MTDHLRTLNRFVLRGRRIAAHSLARDREVLRTLAQMTVAGRIRLDGTMEIRRTLPDEELFESLAARVRPVLVKKESVHHGRIIAAIADSIASSTVEVPDALQEQVRALAGDWPNFDLDGTAVLRFAVQSASAEGSEVSPQVSDTQLAAAWLYGDLVHVDTHGSKSDGLLFPVKERYSAAVTYFAHAALLCLATLDLVLELDRLGAVQIDADSTEREVVVGLRELVEEGVAYVGPAEAPMPSLDMAVASMPDGFRAMTVTELLRQRSENRVRVVCRRADGSSAADYEAAVIRRDEQDGHLIWEALVAGSVRFSVSATTAEDELVDLAFDGIKRLASTNQMKFAEAELDLALAESEGLEFWVGDINFFTLSISMSQDDREAASVAADTYGDLAAIEAITRLKLPLLAGAYSNEHRALLRRTRLLWEGEVVQFRLGPLSATTAFGTIPGSIMMAAEKVTMANVEIPTPLTVVRHPAMIPSSVTPLPDRNPPADSVTMTIPTGEPFLAWAPEKRTVSGDSDLSTAIAWNLSYFDEEPFLGVRQDSAD